jgi:hypothetical protein
MQRGRRYMEQLYYPGGDFLYCLPVATSSYLEYIVTPYQFWLYHGLFWLWLLRQKKLERG